MPLKKIREVHCSDCYTKIFQTGRGRTATRCSGCRKRREEQWRYEQSGSIKPKKKRTDVVGGDNT